ncbi:MULTISPECIES: protein-L-isoaspartate(D-aspartate) O-methyltransferase [Rhodanobacter]|uniref:protein-L-isoaspartate(D-aspartate) O-methyltransferase n=1 Tax=Rhodanobacter TaxID=75309 RepID=UPI0004804728|nr:MULTISPECIES: protein-L-isoaspartate(D-aspartate) O-methyltransferase [Rhodanobacter]KZC20219.1 protein-L-isoaspartate O-methyltransferase [Rhodanobacter denitrificans]UJJ49581.1 protein-L-isoaspartate(D-aspartate) O-methyltransferase [Rhodanobacter denitrificans]UJJ58221.1 protein-L-isoaspartate(D-aspartate) O-methyltransferase [Rhodanobacter denitrificans]UJM92295.1 protein-L-isoaspartate(D-aspartate) O-methyltransferase [Rhodanobacter denitrificans]UJM95824.1 protein-L-isoaspartate(D-asp
MTTYPLPAADLKGEGMTSQRARDRLAATLKDGGIRDLRVIEVIRNLPRHHFIDQALHSRAYENDALPIGHGQTISQPWVVARMTEALLEFGVPQKVLEIGTGSGYQAAVLAALVPQVFTVERIEALLRQARRRFRQLGLANLRSRYDDGKLGWPDEAPFDAIILTAAGDTIPTRILDQLSPTGVLVAPVGSPSRQTLIRMHGDGKGDFIQEELGAVSFVPLLGGIG